ncbi:MULTISPECIES: chloride channel protein [Burkholderiales]|nr:MULTISPECIES: chloride channel protein [Burkholderiales]
MAANEFPEEVASPRRGRARLWAMGPAAETLRVWWWAAVTGALAAAAVLGFRWLTQWVEELATGQRGGLVEAALSLSPWHRALVCTLGGLLAGLVLQGGTAWARRGPGGAANLDYIDAARAGRVDLNDRTTLTRTVSALLSVGTGASIGREGPMVQLAAWVSARLARLVATAPEQRNTLLVCGIAAGIGSAYHAPIAGVVFVLELALGFLARHTVAPVLIASATASSLIYWLVEPKPLYDVPPVVMAPTSLGIALLAGVLFGGLGWGLLALLESGRSWFARIRTPVLRLGLGGLLVGLLSAWVPQVWGNGYSVVSQVLHGDHAWQWLAWVLLAKVVATTLSSGSGAIGGVFTPSLFVGATAGSVLAQVAALWLPAVWVGDPRLLAVVGMAAVLAAVTHAPLMAIVMVLEMTNQFQLTVPVMLACGVAYAISTQFGARPLYGNPIESPMAQKPNP